MAEELGEVEEETDLENPTKRLEGLKKLQGLVSFLPTSKPFIGFGEHFPVDGIGKDGLASAANRRVEVMFFESGHEPDVGILNEAPDVSELYQAESYERAGVSQRDLGVTSLAVPFQLDLDRDPSESTKMILRNSTSGEEIVRGVGHEDVFNDETLPLRWYRFRDIPAGGYDLWVDIAGIKTCTVRGIKFGRQGIFIGGSRARARSEAEVVEQVEVADLEELSSEDDVVLV